MRSDYCTFRLAQLIHILNYLLIIYGLLNISSEIRVIAVCLIPPIFHHRPSYVQKAKSKLSPIKNPRDRHIHNSLSNVVIHMPCVNIHRAGRD